MPSLSLRDRRLRARGFNARQRVALGGRRFLPSASGEDLGSGRVLVVSDQIVLIPRVPDSDEVTLTVVVSGNSTPFSIEVDGTDITVNSATSAGGAATTTVAAAVNSLNRDADVSVLVWAQEADHVASTAVLTAAA